jgi:branched-chain amino acid transport system substrate-binding protein
MRVLNCLIASGIVVLGSAGCGPVEPVKIGFISGQTGPFSDLGRAGLNGAILAVEERNVRGGVGQRPVTLVIRDDEHNPAKAKEALASLVKDGVLAVVGPMTSAMATELVPLADAEKIVLMGGTVVTNRLSGKDDYFLRAISPSSHYATYSADVHQKRLQPRRVAVVFDAANRDYAENWARDYAARLEQSGETRCTVIEIDTRTPHSFESIRQTILAGTPDLVTLATSARTAANLMLAVRRVRGDMRFAVSAWAANQVLLDTAGNAAEGALVEQYHNLFDETDTYRHFDQRFRERFQRGPDYAAVIAYDATHLILDGLDLHPQKAGLKEVLLQKRKFAALQVTIEIDRQGDAVRPGFTTTVKNRQFSPLP